MSVIRKRLHGIIGDALEWTYEVLSRIAEHVHDKTCPCSIDYAPAPTKRWDCLNCGGKSYTHADEPLIVKCCGQALRPTAT